MAALNVKIDISGMLAKFKNVEDLVLQEAQVLVNQASQVGAEVARYSLNTAITPWGLYRMSINMGNSPGRNDTGEMISKLNAYPGAVTADRAVASFGWRSQGRDEYFRLQELGTEKIEAANSLLDGANAVTNELPRLERNMRQRIARKAKK